MTSQLVMDAGVMLVLDEPIRPLDAAELAEQAAWEARQLTIPPAPAPRAQLFEGVCQDCIRVRSFACFVAAHTSLCADCGGDMCSCPDCHRTVAALRAGERGTVSGRLQHPISDWSAEHGVVLMGMA